MQGHFGLGLLLRHRLQPPHQLCHSCCWPSRPRSLAFILEGYWPHANTGPCGSHCPTLPWAIQGLGHLHIHNLLGFCQVIYIAKMKQALALPRPQRWGRSLCAIWLGRSLRKTCFSLIGCTPTSFGQNCGCWYYECGRELVSSVHGILGWHSSNILGLFSRHRI
jgi:hypothetical protein